LLQLDELDVRLLQRSVVVLGRQLLVGRRGRITVALRLRLSFFAALFFPIVLSIE
jgi:hypothetical protein